MLGYILLPLAQAVENVYCYGGTDEKTNPCVGLFPETQYKIVGVQTTKAFQADGYPPDGNTAATSYLMFTQSIDVTPVQLKFVESLKGIVTYGCELKCTDDLEIPTAQFTKYTMFSFSLSAGKKITTDSTAITAQNIKAFGCPVELTGTVATLALTDLDTFPTVSLATGGAITTFKLDHLAPGRSLAVQTNTEIKFGTLTIDMTKFKLSHLEFPKNTIFTSGGQLSNSEVTTITITGGPIIFDKSWSTKTATFTATGVTVYIIEATSAPYVTGTFKASAKAYCIYKDTVPAAKDGCSKFKDYFEIAEAQHVPSTETAFSANSIIVINDELTVDAARVTALQADDKIVDGYDATKIVQTIANNVATTTTFIVDPTTPALQFETIQTTAHLLNPTVNTVALASANANPAVLTNSVNTKFSAPGSLALSGTETFAHPFTLALITPEATELPTVQITGQNPAITITKDTFKVNGLEFPLTDKTKVEVASGSDVTFSAEAEAADGKILTLSGAKTVSFDASFNSFTKPFITIKNVEKVTTKSDKPGWLSPDTMASVPSVSNQPVTPPQPTSGLEGWAIALIVIACVIVVAVIIVVVLQFTGVIHICGKKKVEV